MNAFKCRCIRTYLGFALIRDGEASTSGGDSCGGRFYSEFLRNIRCGATQGSTQVGREAEKLRGKRDKPALWFHEVGGTG